MLTIWSRIIQDLLKSDDGRAGHLAMALVDDKRDFYRWAIQSPSEQISLGLFHLGSKGSLPAFVYANWCVHNRWMSSWDAHTQLRRKMWKLYRRKPVSYLDDKPIL